MGEQHTASVPDDLAARAGAARRVVVLTGAGISAESGVPTFRDAQTGLWASYDPTELATPEAFGRDPALVWNWYAWRRQLVAKARPNAGHLALARWEAAGIELTVVTQNVDGLHLRAGSRRVIELHGDIARTVCSVERSEVTGWEQDERTPPRCPSCGAALRPDVVWFGEMLPEGAVEAAVRAIEAADLVLSVGTSSLVQPAASLPLAALRHGIPVVEVNPGETPLTAQVDFSLRGTAGEVLPVLVARALAAASADAP